MQKRKTQTRAQSSQPETQVPDECAIREAAYQRYTERVARGIPGDEMSDWLSAEADLERHDGPTEE